jgi:hypothetical protein
MVNKVAEDNAIVIVAMRGFPSKSLKGNISTLTLSHFKFDIELFLEPYISVKVPSGLFLNILPGTK